MNKIRNCQRPLSDVSSKVAPLCISAGQAAGFPGQAMGGCPRNSAVTPGMGPQRPGAPGRLASGAALCGVGEDQQHHPHGGAGHHRSADGGLRRKEGSSQSRLISPRSPFLVWERFPVRIECRKPREEESWSQNQCLQPLARAGRKGEEDWCTVGGGDGIFNVASLRGLLVSECSEGLRVSGAVGGFHGPGPAVVPLALHQEFHEPAFNLGSEDVVDMSVLLFFFLHLTLEKKNKLIE